MAVIREGGTDPGSLKGRKGGTKGTDHSIVANKIYTTLSHRFLELIAAHFQKIELSLNLGGHGSLRMVSAYDSGLSCLSPGQGTALCSW